MSDQDSARAFRNALGAFATGVTIATTLDASDSPVGVTASSFNSVSVAPQLVLWSLAKNSHSRDAFCTSGHFAVHILATTQEELSNKFARSGENKFAGIDWTSGELGSPVLPEYAALFQCRTRHQYEGGDHIILVGEVISYETRDAQPLIFHGGRYAERRPKAGGTEAETVDIEHGSFSDDFLFYLISRAHFQTSRPTRDKLAEFGSTMEEYLTLAILSMEAPLTRDEIGKRLNHTGHVPAPRLLDHMTRQKLIKEVGPDPKVEALRKFDLADKGRELFVETLAFGKAMESDLAAHFTAAELSETKRVLRKVIEITGPDVPIAWRGKA